VSTLSTPIVLMTATVECPVCAASLPVEIRLSIADMYTDPDADGSALWADTDAVRAHIKQHQEVQ
jgi:hypothetical protein